MDFTIDKMVLLTMYSKRESLITRFLMFFFKYKLQYQRKVSNLEGSKQVVNQVGRSKECYAQVEL